MPLTKLTFCISYTNGLTQWEKEGVRGEAGKRGIFLPKNFYTCCTKITPLKLKICLDQCRAQIILCLYSSFFSSIFQQQQQSVDVRNMAVHATVFFSSLDQLLCEWGDEREHWFGGGGGPAWRAYPPYTHQRHLFQGWVYCRNSTKEVSDLSMCKNWTMKNSRKTKRPRFVE